MTSHILQPHATVFRNPVVITISYFLFDYSVLCCRSQCCRTKSQHYLCLWNISSFNKRILLGYVISVGHIPMVDMSQMYVYVLYYMDKNQHLSTATLPSL